MRFLFSDGTENAIIASVMHMKEILNKKILIVDDEKELLKTVQDALFKEGFFNLITASSCREAAAAVKNQPVALMLLDVNLPDGSGFALYRELREYSAAPVIFLTARGDDDDRLTGLGLGADDYVVKPFLMRELVLRINALLRRTYAIAEDETGALIGGCYVDFTRASARRGENEVPLTAKELILIKKLWENKNRIVSFDSLCMAAWGEDYYGHENTLTVHIRRLREKIEADPSAPQHILTARGLGYRLAV